MTLQVARRRRREADLAIGFERDGEDQVNQGRTAVKPIVLKRSVLGEASHGLRCAHKGEDPSCAARRRIGHYYLGEGIRRPRWSIFRQRAKLVPKNCPQNEPNGGCVVAFDNGTSVFPALTWKPSDGLEPSTPSLPWRCSTN
jgi:hypothetical protein